MCRQCPIYNDTLDTLVEDIVIVRDLKVSISDNSNMCSCSRNAEITFVEIPTLKIKLLRARSKLGIINFAWRVTWKYNYSP